MDERVEGTCWNASTVVAGKVMPNLAPREAGKWQRMMCNGNGTSRSDFRKHHKLFSRIVNEEAKVGYRALILYGTLFSHLSHTRYS